MASTAVLKARLDRMTKPKTLEKGELDRCKTLETRIAKLRAKPLLTKNDEKRIMKLEHLIRDMKRTKHTGRELNKIRRLKRQLEE